MSIDYNDEDYKAGLATLKTDYYDGEKITSTCGETLLRLKKAGRDAPSDITYSGNLTVEQFNALRLAVDWSPVEHSLVEKCLEHTAFLVVANSGNEPIGMARVITDYGYQVLIADVIVRPEYQGKGIGKEIMTRVMENINQNIAPGQSKMINLMSALGKDGFYTQFGFERRPNDNRGPGMSQWISREIK